MKVVASVCPLDCPDTCTLHVEVDAGRVTSVDAAPDGNPLTSGFICQKVKHHASRIYAPERILHPMVRVGPKGSSDFESVTWDTAIALVAERMNQAIAEFGPGSIVPYLYGSSSPATQGVLGRRYFRRIGASVVDATVCAATHAAAYESVFGTMLSADPRDVAASDVVVVWGANPTVTNVHFPPLVTAAQRDRGTKLVVVDPRRTAMAKRADLHLAVRPGTDVVLALAVARELEARGALAEQFLSDHVEGVDGHLAAAREYTLERAAALCGIDASDLARFVDLLTSSRRVFHRVGWGLERNRNGGSACAAVFAVPLLAGHFGVRGAGVMGSLSDAAPFVSPMTDADRVQHAPRPRHFNMNNFGAALCDTTLDPPIRVLFVQGSNLAATNPDQVRVLRGLARDDVFTVVHDQVLTDTARYADVVLPATTHFETHDVVNSYGSYTLQETSPIIDRVGESRSDNEVIALIAVATGQPADEFDPSPEAVRASLLPSDAVSSIELRAEGTTVQFVDTFPSYAGQRARLSNLSDIGVPRFVDLHDTHPLTLLTPASPKTINSMFAEFQAPDPAVRLHPVDAVARGLRDGQTVRVFNERAEVVTTVQFDDDLIPGVATMPKGSWCRDFEGGLTANALVPDSLSDLAGGACFNDTRVEVRSA